MFYHLKISKAFIPKLFGLIIVGIFLFGCKSDSNHQNVSSGDPEIDAVSAEINNDGQNAGLYYKRAQLFYEKESFDKTIVDMQKALLLDSMNAQYYHFLSDAYLNYYNSKDALNTMVKVISLYPERVPSLLKMAELKHILEDFDGSILTVNEVIRLDPQNADAYFILGMNFRAIQDIERSINAFQTAVEMNSRLTDGWIILGELYEEKKDPKALQYYESAILSNPESMQALHAKAYYIQNHGDIPGAQQIYREIIVKDQSYTDAYLNSGFLYLEVDSIDRAFEQFDLLTGIAPTNYMGFYMRGIVNEKKGNITAARNDYQSAFNLNNKDPKVKEALDKILNQSIY